METEIFLALSIFANVTLFVLFILMANFASKLQAQAEKTRVETNKRLVELFQVIGKLNKKIQDQDRMQKLN